MKPSEKYSDLMQQTAYTLDPAQESVTRYIDDLYHRIVLDSFDPPRAWWQRLRSPDKRKTTVKGLYLWGGVGRGKTFLMDIFYSCLPDEKKMRTHFHAFLQQIHHELQQQSQLKNPLQRIAEDLAQHTRILCLDEFSVNDIADAMILSGLFGHLLQCGITLVTTSNSPPQDLYHDGLQRAQFLPAIALITRYCNVVHIDAGEDYRLRGLRQAQLYSVPHSQAAMDSIEAYLSASTESVQSHKQHLKINGRSLSIQRCTDSTVWFSFQVLCKSYRSQSDYLEIARLFNTLIVTDIEIMSAMQDDTACRFILLIDILYDHRVKLICTAAASAASLYQGQRLRFEFERTYSRLMEMQSQDYLGAAHQQQWSMPPEQ